MSLIAGSISSQFLTSMMLSRHLLFLFKNTYKLCMSMYSHIKDIPFYSPIVPTTSIIASNQASTSLQLLLSLLKIYFDKENKKLETECVFSKLIFEYRNVRDGNIMSLNNKFSPIPILK